MSPNGSSTFDPSIFPEEPVPLITFDEDDNLMKMNDRAIELLKQIEGNISVIAMAGLYRTGKSSMLNWLIGRQSGFRVGPTIERCTRGIWLWGRPQKHRMANGEDVWVLMLDTEGLGGLEASQQYDMRIFSLATLLCSKLVYNSQGSVDEKAINGLSFIANLSKHIKIHADKAHGNDNGNDTDEQDDMDQFHNFFPSFMWIVRDFTLDLVDDDGDPISPNEYLENALDDQPGFTPATMERNRVRKMLKAFFKERECVTLVRPVHEEHLLQQVDKLSISELRVTFQEQLAELRNKVFGQDLKPKLIQNKPLNGSMFAGMVQAYVDSINQGGVPVITSAWEGVTSSECRKALQAAVEELEEALATLALPLDDDDLDNRLKELERQAHQTYRHKAIGEATGKFEKELVSRLEAEKNSLKQNNLALSKESCERLLQVLYSQIIQPQLTKSLANNAHDANSVEDLQLFATAWSNFRQRYLNQAKGGAKMESLLVFSEVKYAEAMKILLSRQEETYEKHMRVLQQDVAKAKEELGSVGGREQIFKEQIEKMQLDSSSLMSEKARLQAETQAQEVMISRLKEQLKNENLSKQNVEIERESMDLRLTTELQQKDELHEEMERLKERMNQLQLQKEATETQLNLLHDENDKLRNVKTCGACVIA